MLLSPKPGSLIFQFVRILMLMAGFGRSKHEDKKRGLTKKWIYSSCTMTNYIHCCARYAKWARCRFGCRTVKQARQYVALYLMCMIENGYRPHTIHQMASALAKAYHCHSWEFGVLLPKRHRDDRVKNLQPNPLFDEKKYHMLVQFMRASGLRKKCLRLVTPDDVFIRNGKTHVRVRRGKGGRSRVVTCLDDTPWHIAQEAKREGRKLIFPTIPRYCCTHYYRREFATKLMERVTRDVRNLPEKEKYYCRMGMAGVCFDKKAMLEVSHALGHGRPEISAVYIIVTEENAHLFRGK